MLMKTASKSAASNFNMILLADKNQRGFTILESLLSIFIFTLSVLAVFSVYNLAQTTYRQAGDKNELWQNARVVLDRLTRDFRQTTELVTALPAGADDPFNPPPNAILFQNGHNTETITYIKYLQISSEIHRQTIAYYFDQEPGTYVRWNSRDIFNNPPQEAILEDQLAGEYFSSIKFWGENGLIYISVILNKSDQQAELLTAVYGRNL